MSQMNLCREIMVLRFKTERENLLPRWLHTQKKATSAATAAAKPKEKTKHTEHMIRYACCWCSCAWLRYLKRTKTETKLKHKRIKSLEYRLSCISKIVRIQCSCEQFQTVYIISSWSGTVCRHRFSPCTCSKCSRLANNKVEKLGKNYNQLPVCLCVCANHKKRTSCSSCNRLYWENISSTLALIWGFYFYFYFYFGCFCRVRVRVHHSRSVNAAIIISPVRVINID